MEFEFREGFSCAEFEIFDDVSAVLCGPLGGGGRGGRGRHGLGLCGGGGGEEEGGEEEAAHGEKYMPGLVAGERLTSHPSR